MILSGCRKERLKRDQGSRGGEEGGSGGGWKGRRRSSETAGEKCPSRHTYSARHNFFFMAANVLKLKFMLNSPDFGLHHSNHEFPSEKRI